MKIKNTNFQTFIEIICIGLIITTAVYTAITWNTIPENVPVHYNFKGEIDSYGSKMNLFVLPIINITMYLTLTIVTFFPNLWSVPVVITEKNKEFVYTNTKSLIIVMKLVTVSIFSYLSYATINTINISIFFTVIALVSTFIPSIYYIYKIIVGSRKYK